MKTLFSLSRQNHALANAATDHVLANAATLGAFNPALPLDGSLVVADVLRDQFNGLAAMIAAVSSVNAAVVDGVQTLLPSESAYVTLTLNVDTLHFLFGIPRGDVGAQGAPGIQGPPFAQAVVDGVTTLPPGYAATVTVSFDGTDVHFSFGIPRGDVGQQGEQGIQGPPGEVTLAELNISISGTSANSNAVATLEIPVSDPPTQAEVQQVLSKMNELITALRR